MVISATNAAARTRPLWLGILAVLYIILGVVTALPQFYYLLYYAHVAPASPHGNLLGQIWYWYGTQVDTGALSTDSGTVTGAVEDAFFLWWSFG